jgi:hypothetical protein
MFIVFFLSGILHIFTDRVQAIPYEYSGAMIAFPITTFGIMFEDGVQELWKRFSGPEKGPSNGEKSAPPLWQRIVGYVWTMTWLGVVSTWYLYPQDELPGELTTFIPISLTEKFGVQPLGSVVLGGVLLVSYIFGPEI